MGREDGERDGRVRNVLQVAGNFVRAAVNLLSDLLEIVELIAFLVHELTVRLASVLLRCCHTHRLSGCVKSAQAEHKRASGDDSGSSGQEIAAHDRLNHGGLARGLRAHGHNDRQLDAVASRNSFKGLLKLAYNRNECFHLCRLFFLVSCSLVLLTFPTVLSRSFSRLPRYQS